MPSREPSWRDLAPDEDARYEMANEIQKRIERELILGKDPKDEEQDATK